MNFKKDLLIIDTELTGLDADKHEIIQLAAVLLDRKTLKEKRSFNSYIKPVKWSGRDPVAMKVNGLSLKDLDAAPKLNVAIKQFSRTFNPEKVLLTAYVGYIDKRFLLEAYKKAGVKWKFNYHYLDIWSVAFAFLAKHGQLKNNSEFTGFNLESLLKKFKIKLPGSHHDALFDCRAEAEVLRRILRQK